MTATIGSKMDKPFKGNKRITIEQLRMYDRAMMLQHEGKPYEHILASGRALGLKPHIANYHAHRLQVRGLVKLVKVGSMVFIHPIKPQFSGVA